MRNRKDIGLAILLAFCWLIANGSSNSLINGDFEQDLKVGWQISTKDYDGSSKIKRVKVKDNYYAKVEKIWCGYAELFQIIQLTNLDQDLSVRLRLNANSNRDGYSALAAFILSFLDEEDKTLARIRIAYSTKVLTNTPMEYNYSALPNKWQTNTINLREELKHFPKIDFKKIAKLKISLYAYGSNTEGC
ncbi:MAG: hypothetical protein ABIK67_08265 [candidate division WOR-3 bacterium]